MDNPQTPTETRPLDIESFKAWYSLLKRSFVAGWKVGDGSNLSLYDSEPARQAEAHEAFLKFLNDL